MGGQARVFQRLTLLVQMVSGSDFEPFYNGFTELWASWKFSDALALTIGPRKHRFTHDRNVSSRYINYLERSMLTNVFAADYTPAITLSGKAGRWNWYGGVFTDKTGQDMEDAFTDLDSGYSLPGPSRATSAISCRRTAPSSTCRSSTATRMPRPPTSTASTAGSRPR